jgi:UDPglucose--hexose-1-phosphate uridylyltransferase
LIVLEKVVKRSRPLNPLKGFAEDPVTFEYRADPLTGRNSTVIGGMLGYVSGFLKSDEQLLGSLVEKTRATCPFCPDSVRTKTPMFTPDFLKEGRLCFEDAVVVPNLLGHAERSVLVVLSKEHYLKLDQFTPELILNGFRGGVAYLRRLKEVEPSIRFPAFVFNYLPPAGSSIFHPHMQVLVRDRPFYLVGLTLEKSRAYSERYGSNYWRDLVEKERGGERHLFANNNVEWLVPFAPLRGMNEVQAVVRGRSNLLELSGEEWFELAEGISKVLRFYQEEGYSSFNVVLMSAPLNEHLDYFDVNLRIISRPGVQGSSFTDAWALPYLLWDGEAVEEPEKFAERVRRFISEVRTRA